MADAKPTAESASRVAAARAGHIRSGRTGGCNNVLARAMAAASTIESASFIHRASRLARRPAKPREAA